MRERLNQHLFTQHLEDDEQVVMVVHKHWLIGVRELFWPSVSFAVLVMLLAGLLTRDQSSLFAYYVVALLAVVVLVWWLRNFFDYYLDAWIITDTGIVDVEWHGWFHRQASRVLYSDIQGVSYEIEGVWSTLMRFGVIAVEKVSTGSVIAIEHVKNPRAVEAVILHHMEEYLHQNNLKDASKVHEILANVIAREIQLQDVRSVQLVTEEEEEEEEEEEDDEDDERDDE